MQTMPSANPVPPKAQPVWPRLQPSLLGLRSQRRQNFALTDGLTRRTSNRCGYTSEELTKPRTESRSDISWQHSKSESVTINSSLRPKCDPLTPGVWMSTLNFARSCVENKASPLVGDGEGEKGMPWFVGTSEETRYKIQQSVHVTEHRLVILPLCNKKRETTATIG